MSLKINKITTLSEVAGAQEKWQRLLERSGSRDFFAHPLWHLSWWQSVGCNRTMEIFVAEDGEDWVGLLPLSRYNSVWDGFARVLELSGGTQADRHNLLTSPGYETRVLQLFEEPLRELLGRVELVKLQGLPEDSPLLRWPVIINQEHRVEQQVMPYLSLPRGEGYDTLEQNWGRAHRGDVRRQMRRLEREGRLELVSLKSPDEALRTLDPFFKALAFRWQSRNYLMRWRLKAIKKFLLQLIKNMWDTGTIHFSTCNLNGTPISYHFGFVHQERFYWYKPAYEPAYQNFSPGKVHLAKLLQLGIQEGWHTVDFLMGGEDYKYLWTKVQENAYTLTVNRSKWPARLVCQCYAWGRRLLNASSS